MALPTLPRIEKFCFCMDVNTGVKSMSIGLSILWIFYAIGAVFGTNTSKGSLTITMRYTRKVLCM